MKKMRLLLLMLLMPVLMQAQDLQIATVINAPVRRTSLNELKGKLVLIEFWATWCGPCLTAMPHLKEIQEKYKDKLQVIAVSQETPQRIAQYIKVKPTNLWMASDTSEVIANRYPHQLIPHTVLLDANSNVVAVTSPENITEKVIDSVLKGMAVHVTEKKDNELTYQDIISKYFHLADDTKENFVVSPEIPGAPGVVYSYLNDPVFKGRRITALNISVGSLYRIAYGDIPYNRSVDKRKLMGKDSVFCMDILAKQGGNVKEALKKELLKRFDVKAKMEKMEKEVYVMRVSSMEKFASLIRNTSGTRTYYSRHGEIDQQMISMKEFAEFLEVYGVNKFVINEVKNEEKFDIKFSFQPEDLSSLMKILDEMGLSFVKEKRGIEMLVLSN